MQRGGGDDDGGNDGGCITTNYIIIKIHIICLFFYLFIHVAEAARRHANSSNIDLIFME